MLTPFSYASFILGIAALAIFIGAGAAPENFVFDREAVERGELWRLITGHLVHADASHLMTNLLALGLVSLLIQRESIRWGLLLFLVGAAGIDAWLWFFRPDIARYCGLSGILYAFIIAGLAASRHNRRCRWLFGAIAMAALAKLFFEIKLGGGLITHTAWPVVPDVHAVGAVAGLVVLASRRVHLSRLD